MLKEQPSHEGYIQFVKTWLEIVYPQGPPPIHAHVATMLMLVNLTPMRKIIEHLYSVLGRPVAVLSQEAFRQEYLKICSAHSSAWYCAVILPLQSGLA